MVQYQKDKILKLVQSSVKRIGGERTKRVMNDYLFRDIMSVFIYDGNDLPNTVLHGIYVCECTPEEITFYGSTLPDSAGLGLKIHHKYDGDNTTVEVDDYANLYEFPLIVESELNQASAKDVQNIYTDSIHEFELSLLNG